MIIFPAIDIQNGQCVRLTQGDYAQQTVYHQQPVEVAKAFEQEGAKFIHLVDLDGAKSGQTPNIQTIAAIAQAVNIPVQVGGGVRSIEKVQQLIEQGVQRVIIGTAAIQNPAFLQKAVEQFGDQIAVSIDARNGFVATEGWTTTSEVKALDLIQPLEQIGVATIVYTDIFKDGMMSGPNFKELGEVNQATTMQVIASGGVTQVSDVEQLERMDLYGAIIGKALYEGTIQLNQLKEE